MSERRDKEIEQEIRLKRPFSLAEAIGREGESFLRGASPVPAQKQALAAISQLLDKHLRDTQGALRAALRRRAQQRVEAGHADAPQRALAETIELILSDQDALSDFVTEVDAEWGRMFDERPHFDKPDQAPSPEDPYPLEAVRGCLAGLLRDVGGQLQPPPGAESNT